MHLPAINLMILMYLVGIIDAILMSRVNHLIIQGHS